MRKSDLRKLSDIPSATCDKGWHASGYLARKPTLLFSTLSRLGVFSEVQACFVMYSRLSFGLVMQKRTD